MLNERLNWRYSNRLADGVKINDVDELVERCYKLETQFTQLNTKSTRQKRNKQPDKNKDKDKNSGGRP